MASKYKTREVTIVDKSGAFNAFFKRFAEEKQEYDFEGLKALRRLLNNEKLRILHVIKNKNPSSIYELAKILNRDFKSVVSDIKLLERFGFINMLSERSGKRQRLKPIVVIDSLYLQIKI